MHVNRKVKEEASQQARPTVQGERTKEIFATLVASQTAGGGGGDEARVARWKEGRREGGGGEAA